MKRFLTCLVVLVICMVSLFSGCAVPHKAQIVCPDGAPALILSTLKDLDVSIKVYENSNAVATIGAQMVKGEVDYAILPVSNATTKNAQSNNQYVMAGVITHGNLYAIGLEDLGGVQNLVGKSVGVIQLNSVPGFAVKKMLEGKGIAYCTDYAQKSENNVYLFNIQPAQAMSHLSSEVALDKKADVCIVAEPLCSKLVSAKGAIVCFDVQDEYKHFPQAVLMVKKSVQNSALTTKIINALSAFDAQTVDVNESVQFVQSKMSSTTSLVGISRNAIVGSNVYFTHARTCKQEVIDYIQEIKTFDTPLASVAESVTDAFFME